MKMFRGKNSFYHFVSDELVDAIKNDIAVANDKLNLPVYSKYKDHEFFYANLTLSTNKNSTIGSVNGNSV